MTPLRGSKNTSPPRPDQAGSVGASPGISRGVLRCIKDVQSVLSGLESEFLDDQALQQLVDAKGLADEEQVLIQELSSILQRGDVQEAELPRVSRDAWFEVKVVEAGWLVTLDLEPAIGQGKAVTTAMIVEQLKRMGAVKGVNIAAIKKAVDQQHDGAVRRGLCIARGRLPRPGKAGYVEVYCRAGPEAEPGVYQGLASVPEHGAERVCRAGDRIARCHPPEPGEPGFNVMGELIQPEAVASESFEPGENAHAEGDELIADADGTIDITGQRIGVRRVLMINRDVVGKEQQVYFDGDITVDGSARGGCAITATGDVTVKGTVGDAQIKSTHGSVYLNQGVAGQHKAKIAAARDIFARFVENAELQAGHNIELDTGSMHANMSAGHEFICDSSRGQVLGGVLIAGQCVRVKQLGNQNGVATTVMCGYSPRQLQQRSEIALKIAAGKNRLADLNEAAEGIRRMAGDIQRLSGDNQAVFAKLLQAILLTRRQLDDLEARSRQIEEDPDRPENAQVRASSMIHPGVECWIGAARLAISEPKRACRVVMHQDHPRVHPL